MTASLNFLKLCEMNGNMIIILYSFCQLIHHIFDNMYPAILQLSIPHVTLPFAH